MVAPYTRFGVPRIRILTCHVTSITPPLFHKLKAPASETGRADRRYRAVYELLYQLFLQKLVSIQKLQFCYK